MSQDLKVKINVVGFSNLYQCMKDVILSIDNGSNTELLNRLDENIENSKQDEFEMELSGMLRQNEIMVDYE